MRRTLDCPRRSAAALACLLACTAVPSGGCLDVLPELDAKVGDPVAARCVGDDSDPAVSVSFRRDILPILTRTQAGAAGCSCHLPTSANRIGLELGGLDLSSYAGMATGGLNSRGVVIVPGDPCASIIVQKTGAGPPFGSRMPFNGPPFLSDSERQLVSDWIAEGANDD